MNSAPAMRTIFLPPPSARTRSRTLCSSETGTVVVEQGCRDESCAGGGEKTNTVPPEFAPVHFDLGKAEVRPDQLGAVAAVRDWLHANPGTAVLLRAHTDTTAAADINIALARRRAGAVRAMLADEGGIARDRIFTAELPEHALPVVTGPETTQPQNRVVQFIPIRFPQRQ